MLASPIPENETQRLAALHSYGILDNEAYACMQPLTKLAADICDCPIALITLVDEDRQWFYTNVGLEEATETPRDISFCGHVIFHKKTMVISNTLNDDRFCDNPLVTDNPNIKFYAAAPLINKDGFAIGTLCVIDTVSKKFSQKQISLLERLSDVVIKRLDNNYVVPQLNRYIEKIENKNALYNSLLNTNILGIAIFDNNGAIIDQNDCFKSLWKIHDEILFENDPTFIKAHLRDQVAIPGEYVNHSGEISNYINIETIDILHMKNGMVLERHDYPFIKDDKPIAWVCFYRDVTDHHIQTEKLSFQATHDLLTGLVNRFEFERRLDRMLSETNIIDTEHVYCFMDLDNFKHANDAFGHSTGDYLLREISKLLSHNIRKRDTLARIGGDEFGLLMENCTIKQAKRVANKLIKALKEFEFEIYNNKLDIGISIGMISIDATLTNKIDIFSKADEACYKAKDAGRNRIYVG